MLTSLLLARGNGYYLAAAYPMLCAAGSAVGTASRVEANPGATKVDGDLGGGRGSER